MKQNLHGNLFWKIYRYIVVVEQSALDCLTSLFDTGLWDNPGEASRDISMKAACFVKYFEPKHWISMFRVHWASVVFEPYVHIPAYLKSDYIQSNFKLNIDEKALLEVKEDFLNISTALIKTTSDSFKLLALGSDPSYREIRLRVWAMRSNSEIEADLDLAFVMFKLSMMFIDALRNDELSRDFSHFKELQLLADLWGPRSPEAMISVSEAYAFRQFFGNVEVKLGKFQLEKIYFPIPQSCRVQKDNPLVKEEMNFLLENVDRSDPEKKINNFLDRILPVKHVIEFQHALRNEMRFKRLYGFMTAHNGMWVFIAFCIALAINICMLLYVSKKYSPDEDYLPKTIYRRLRFFSNAHVLMSLVILINYAVGQAIIIVKMGFQWRKSVQEKLISLDWLNLMFGSASDDVFQFLIDTIPSSLWATYFVLFDARTIYYALFIVFSLLGRFVSLAFFSFHLMDITTRYSTLINVVRSVTMNKTQVLVTFLLGAAVIWVYTVIGVYSWGFNVWSYGDSNDYEWQNSLASVFGQQLDYGLRGPPVFDEYGRYFWWKVTYDTTYQILIIVIMVAIVTGIIIDTFGALREQRNEIETDALNVCFICSVERNVFERNK